MIVSPECTWLVVMTAPDGATLSSRCTDIRSSMGQFDWRPIEPESDHDLEQLVNATWPLLTDDSRSRP